eukprot:288099_1
MNVDRPESVVAICVAVVISILSLHLVHHLFTEKYEMSLTLKILCFIFCCTYIPLTICNWFSFTVGRENRFIYNLFFNIFYDIINLCLYSIIVLRYHQTFRLSQYRSSNKMYIFIFGLIITYFTIYSIWILMYALAYDYTGQYQLSTFLTLFITESFLLIIDGILTVIINYLFCRNLVLLAVSITYNKHNDSQYSNTKKVELVEPSKSSTNISTTDTITTPSKPNTSTATTSLLYDGSISFNKKHNNMDNYYTLNEKQKRLIAVTIRLIILTLPAMITTSLVWIVSLSSWYLHYFGPKNIYMINNWILHVIIVPCDSMSNFLCVYLAFDFVAQYYDIVCCCIHTKCYNMFEKIIQRKIVNKLSLLE